jgi:hypothetical protein
MQRLTSNRFVGVGLRLCRGTTANGTILAGEFLFCFGDLVEGCGVEGACVSEGVGGGSGSVVGRRGECIGIGIVGVAGG